MGLMTVVTEKTASHVFYNQNNEMKDAKTLCTAEGFDFLSNNLIMFIQWDKTAR